MGTLSEEASTAIFTFDNRDLQTESSAGLLPPSNRKQGFGSNETLSCQIYFLTCQTQKLEDVNDEEF